MQLGPGVFRRLLLLLPFCAALISAGAPAVAQDFANGLVDAVTVDIVNRRPVPIYVVFSSRTSLPAQASWTASCLRFNNEVRIFPGQTCRASVPTSVGPSRICASETPTAPGKSPNCYDAQRTNQTIIDTNFSLAAGCYPGQKGCVWYSVNVAPANCTDCEWQANNCRDEGGPAYNLPVRLSCAGSPSFTCRGPVAPVGAYGAKYPANCGAPYVYPNCIGGVTATCLQAYFYPMSASGACKYPATLPQPIAQCAQGQTLLVNFLDGY
ncbi:MAG: hypothetical protein ACR652_05485 [Methylocystis sp.]|uniref:hypothetical protein n=1 Tax=Methylocystis sp. TaxID=1911079 RepID=UPI003DA23DB4